MNHVSHPIPPVFDNHSRVLILGSSDSSIKNVIPNRLALILSAAPIAAIYTNGATAYRLYEKYCFPATQRKAEKLRSTSPANAASSLEKLTGQWMVIKNEANIL